MTVNTRPAGDGRQLAVFRHAYTKKGEARGRGSHLSAQGVALARRIGAGIGPCDRVYVSLEQRTLETALAMGFAVDAALEFSCGYVAGEFEHHAQWDWDQPYVCLAELLVAGGRLGARAAADAALWGELVSAAPPGGQVLVVSHGGSIEPVLVACMPEADHTAWGQAFAHGDGVVLTHEGGRFVEAVFRRAPVS